jgi:hypothetical protein
MLRSVDWWLVTGVFRQPIDPTFKGQAVQEEEEKKKKKAFFLESLALEDGTERLSRNVGNYHSTLLNIPEE